MIFNKVIDELSVILHKLANYINPEIAISFDNFSGCDYDDNVIAVGLYPVENPIDAHHKEYYIQNGYDYTKYGISFETFTFLHEIGHIQSDPAEEDFENYYEEREKINNNIKFNGEPLNETLTKYYNLRLEVLADQWAFEYLEKNVKLIQLFDNAYVKLRAKLFESK